jgi:hypothetical protein
VKIVVGSDFTMPDALASHDSSSSAPGSAEPTAAAVAATGEAQPDSGKPVTTSIGSDIPCVN